MFFNKKRKAEAQAADEAASLQPALSQLDLFSSRLDTLRQQYNDTARELANIQPPDMPTPAAAFKPVAVVPRPEGRYQLKNPPDPQPVKVRQPPPLPTPAKKSPPKSTRSGRYYIQVADAKDSAEFVSVREQVSKCGRVVDSGQGTASDPNAAWLEVAVRADDTGTFNVKLEELEVKDRVKKMIPVAPGEGRLQAKQLDLFRRKQDSGGGI